MVGKPNRGRHTGGCLLPDVLREDRRAVAVLRKNYTTRKARHARANDRNVSRHSQMVGTDRRAVRKFFAMRYDHGAPGARALP